LAISRDIDSPINPKDHFKRSSLDTMNFNIRKAKSLWQNRMLLTLNNIGNFLD